MNHIWGLLLHPNQELQHIAQEDESVVHHYAHHVLLMAAVPVLCAFIGTTQSGWNFGEGKVAPVDIPTAGALGVLFYLLILGGVAVMGRVIHWMARKYPQRPSIRRCTVFAGYVATPLMASGVIGVYPLIWLCLLVGSLALVGSACLLLAGIPSFLQIGREESLRFAGSTLAVGVLVLEVLLIMTAVLWVYGPKLL